MPSLNKQLAKLIKTRPQYQVNDAAYENQALASANAFAPDRAIEGQRNQLEQDTANALGQAQQVSSSSSGILSTLAKLNESKNATMRGLATDEAAIQRDKLRDLYQANENLIGEQDKAWNYNVNEPYQNQVQMVRDKKKARQENMWKILDTVGSLGVGALTGGTSSLSKGLLGSGQSGSMTGSGAGINLY